MVINEKETRNDFILTVAKAMMGAARTAPKAKGVDKLEILTIVDAKDMGAIAQKMNEIGESPNGMKFFLRDSINVTQSDAIVVIGTRLGEFGLNCGFCGFPTCEEKMQIESVPCAFNINDLGIAIGSAVSVAADYRVDNRVMWSVADAAMKLGILGDCKAAFAILLSCKGKSPFFDRQPK